MTLKAKRPMALAGAHEPRRADQVSRPIASEITASRLDLQERLPLCLAAIDPGLTGAIAFYFALTPERVSVFDMPVVGSEVEHASLARLLRQHAPAFALVEQVGPMPKDGAQQAFRFGAAYAVAKATVSLIGIPLHLVTPHVWKRHYRIGGGAEGKEQARALALRLFPASAEHFARKKDHGRAEAALLAKFAAETVNG